VQRPSAETLLAVLGTLGVEVSRPEDAAGLLREHLQAKASVIAPVIVVWDGSPATVEISAPDHLGALDIELVLEDGSKVDQLSSPVACAPGLRLITTPGLPFGYHELHVRVGGTEARSTVLSAPMKAWTERKRQW